MYCVLTSFPEGSGVYDTLRSSNIVGFTSRDNFKHWCRKYSAYFQIHQEHDNFMTTKITGAITLLPTSNSLGVMILEPHVW